MKMSGPCFIANENIVVQLDNDVNIHERTDMAFTVSIISCSVISPGLLVMCENMSNCRRSTYHRQSLGSWLVL